MSLRSLALRRFQFELGIYGDDDALAARELGQETLAALPFVLADRKPAARVVSVGDSSVVLRFLGWIDQQDSDWFKAQTQAIVTVKSALEKAGFGLLEPIYRLRFDPRTAPLPVKCGEPGPLSGATPSALAA